MRRMMETHTLETKSSKGRYAINRVRRYTEICVLLLLCALLFVGCTTQTASLPGLPQARGMTPLIKDVPLDKPSEEIVISFVGDLNMAAEVRYETWGACFNEFAKRVGPAYFLQNVAPVFQSDDLTVGDVENVFSDSGLARADKGDEAYAYWYRSSSENAQILSVSGIEIGSIANNHTMDFGVQGYEDTKAALDAVGVMWGDETRACYVERKGIRIGVFCSKLFGSGQLTPILEWLESEEARACDYRIVYFHGGTERIYQPEASKQQMCRRLIDQGAQLVIGSHPHVLQPMEEYNGGYIVYSLGNFLFGGSRTCENETVIYQQILTLQEGKIVSQSYRMIPCNCYTDTVDTPYQPAIVTDEAQKQRIIDYMHGRCDSPML